MANVILVVLLAGEARGMEKKRRFANFIGVCIKADVEAVAFAIHLSLIIIIIVIVMLGVSACVWAKCTVFNIHIRATTARAHDHSEINFTFYTCLLASQFCIIHYSIAVEKQELWHVAHCRPISIRFASFFSLPASPKNRRIGDHVPCHIWCASDACTRDNDRCKIIQLLLSNQRRKKIHQITKWLKSQRVHTSERMTVGPSIELKLNANWNQDLIVKRQLLAAVFLHTHNQHLFCL